MSAQTQTMDSTVEEPKRIAIMRTEVVRKVGLMLELIPPVDALSLFTNAETRQELFLQDATVTDPGQATCWVVLRPERNLPLGVEYRVQPPLVERIHPIAGRTHVAFSTRDYATSPMRTEDVRAVCDALPELQVRLARLLPNTKLLI